MRRTTVLPGIALILALTSVGTFAQLNFNNAQYSIPGPGAAAASADFDRDGLPDVAVGNGNTVSVFLAAGRGQFTAETDYTVSSQATQIVAADFNGDGFVDLLVGNGPMTLLVNNGDGTFTPQDVNVGFTTGGVVGLAAADFNNDGAVDVVVAESTNSGSIVTIFLNDGAGNFSMGERLASLDQGCQIGGLVALDLNGDGSPDVASECSDPPRAVIYLNDGSGNLSLTEDTVLIVSNAPPNSTPAIGTLTWADVNNDGAPDLIFLVGYSCGSSSCGQMSAQVYFNDGSGNFTFGTSTTVWGTGNGGHLLAVDLDGDLVPDLIYWNTQPSDFGGGTQTFLGDGNGNFNVIGSNFNPGDAFAVLGRDLDLDSRHDLVATDPLHNVVDVGLNTSATPNCAPPGSDAVHAQICGVIDAGDGSGAFRVFASGNSAVGIARLELWVDGQKQSQTWNDQLNQTVTFLGGTHTVQVIAVDIFGSTDTATASVTASLN